MRLKSFFNKAAVFSLVSIFSITNSNAQIQQVLEAIKPKKPFEGIPALQQKSQVIQIGIGIPNNVANLMTLNGLTATFGASSTESKLGPIFLNYEYMLRDNIGLGATVSYANAKQIYSLFGSTKIGKLSGLSLLFSTTYHLYTTDKLDPYTKLSIGATLWSSSVKNTDGTDAQNFSIPLPSGFGYSALFGLRYFATPNIALFGEASFSNLKFTGNIGVAFKLK